MAVHVGTGLALVVGSPLTAALSELWGWRLAVAAITVAALAVLISARLALPLMATTAESVQARRRRIGDRRNHRLLIMCALTLVGVTGHFISPHLHRGDHPRHRRRHRSQPGVAAAAAYGVAGLASMAVLARPGDRHPRAAIGGCLGGLALVFAVLATLGCAGGASAETFAGIVAVIAWGATATAMPPMLQSAAMRHSPDDPDSASGLYVAAFQVGIMAGSLLGGLLFEHAGEAVMLTGSAVLVAAAMAGAVLVPNRVRGRSGDQREVTLVTVTSIICTVQRAERFRRGR